MFCVNLNLLPKIANSMYCPSRKVHSYSTRNSDKFCHVRTKDRVRMNSLICVGPKLWDDVPQEIRSSSNVVSFKSKYKKYLLSLQ